MERPTIFFFFFSRHRTQLGVRIKQLGALFLSQNTVFIPKILEQLFKILR